MSDRFERKRPLLLPLAPQAEPVAGASRLGSGEAAGGRVRRKFRRSGDARRGRAQAAHAGNAVRHLRRGGDAHEERAEAVARPRRRQDVPRALRTGSRTGDPFPEGLGPVHPRTESGHGRPERQAGVGPHRRGRSEVPARGAQLGREVEGRAGAPASRLEPAEGARDAQGEEPGPGRADRRGVPGVAPSVGGGRLALPGRARARARDGTFASGPSASSGGSTSTSTVGPSGGGPSTTRRATSTPRPSPPKRCPFSKTPWRDVRAPGTRLCCPP